MSGVPAWIAVLSVLAAVPAMAEPPMGEPPAGAASCAGCHSSTLDGPVPSLRNRTAANIVADMQAFRTGAREATVMDRIAKGFSDEETRAIAQWLVAGRDKAGQPAKP